MINENIIKDEVYQQLIMRLRKEFDVNKLISMIDAPFHAHMTELQQEITSLRQTISEQQKLINENRLKIADLTGYINKMPRNIIFAVIDRLITRYKKYKLAKCKAKIEQLESDSD